MFEYQAPTPKGSHLVWEFIKLQPGQTVKGWINGPLVGLACHWDNGTKPCRDKLTGSTLHCRYCKAEMKTGWVGYLPFYDELGRKCVVAIGREMERSVNALSLGQAVKIGKGKWKTAKVTVQVNEWCVSPCPYFGRLRAPHDIRPWLLVLWKDAELTSHVGEQIGVSPPKMPEAPTCTTIPESEPVNPEVLRAKLAKRQEWDGFGVSPSRKPKNGKPTMNGTH